jgi:Flp pilus assembly protein TadG
MTGPLIALTAVIALALTLPSMAQTSTAKPPATKTTTKKAAAKKAAKPAPVAAAPLSAADDEQKAAAGLAHLGEYACEFNQTVNVATNNLSPGYIDVAHNNQTWVMKPVLSSTGALRLEDVKGRMLMIQIANKSMVMDTQAGQRVLDGCQHEKQREFERTLKGTGTEGTLLRQ